MKTLISLFTSALFVLALGVSFLMPVQAAYAFDSINYETMMAAHHEFLDTFCANLGCYVDENTGHYVKPTNSVSYFRELFYTSFDAWRTVYCVDVWGPNGSGFVWAFDENALEGPQWTYIYDPNGVFQVDCLDMFNRYDPDPSLDIYFFEA